MMRTYQQLIYEQRCQISAFKKSDFSQREIAKMLGVSQSTISRELRRNRGQRGYRHEQAQEKSESCRVAAKLPTKMLPDLIDLINGKLRIKRCPEQISGWFQADQKRSMIHESIYQHVWFDQQCGGDLYLHLRQQGKKYDRRRHGKSTRGQIKNRVSIDERPGIVDEKSRVGDWKVDTFISKGYSGALVSIAERVTKLTVSAELNSTSTVDVTQATIKRLRPFKGIVLTITADTGKEFAYHEKITKALGAQVYFAHPYSSWERGLNENTNGLLRQYFPKRPT